MDCVFCKIANGEIPAKILYESDAVLAFLDAFPLARGHSLVIPKRHFERIQDMPPGVNSAVFDIVRKLASKVDASAGSTLVAVHNGRGSGQEVPHVHVHLIPRSQDDGAGAVHSMFRNNVRLDDSAMAETRNDLRI